MFVLCEKEGWTISKIYYGTSPEGGLIPVWAMWSVTIFSAAWVVYEAVNQMRRLNRSIICRSIKNAMDTLPSAICYFNPSGTVKLCNLQMHRLFRTLAQSDLQSFEELKTDLSECDRSSGVIKVSEERNVYLFPSGKAWRYSQKEVRAKDGVTYTEAAFCDVTELYEKQLELKRDNAEMKKMYRQLKRLSDNVLEMTRENEILTAKTRLHDRMGAGIMAIRQSLQLHHTSEENADAIGRLQKAVSVIKGDNEYPVGRGDVEEFVHDASVVDVKVEISGEIPEDEIVERLFLLAMKECLTNAVLHAGASELRVKSGRLGENYTINIENNGNPPESRLCPTEGFSILNIILNAAEEKWKFSLRRISGLQRRFPRIAEKGVYIMTQVPLSHSL